MNVVTGISWLRRDAVTEISSALYAMRLTTQQGRRAEALRYSEAVPASLAAAILLFTLWVSFELDRTTGAAPAQHLYYVPIIFAAVRFGTAGTLTLAALATLLYHVANPHLWSFRYEETDIVQVALFAAVGIVAAKLAANARRFQQLAMTDDLTGLHNLRSFETRLKAMVRRARATGAPLSVLVLDVDRLKALNDAHGHLAGAEAVRTVGHLLAGQIPDDAIACRYGGDEFVVALPDCGVRQAEDIALALANAVSAAAPLLAGIRFPTGTLAISAGVACAKDAAAWTGRATADDEELGEALFRTADAALYAAKENGRNRVCVA